MKYIYSIKRKVITGKKIARNFGYPTANLKYYKRDEKLSNGVYIVNVQISKNKYKYNGLAFVGKPKVFKKDNKIIEIFIFKYRGNLYNKAIKVNFLKRIRGVKNFKDVRELKVEIKKDVRKAEQFFKFNQCLQV
jgi:riboflavin kinase/FMN adenylyltransferase